MIYAIPQSQSLKLKACKNAVLSTIIKQFSLINRIDLARHRKVPREEERVSVSVFLGVRMRTRCIRSGRDDISVKRSRGTSSEFHSDRMRMGHFLRIPPVPGNNKSTTTH